MAAELWQQLGRGEMLDTQAWPTWDEVLLSSDMMTIAVQVNGKLRGEVTVPTDETKDAVIAAALELPNVQKFTENK
jgi:leucyl-tRNA synthetase